jgi:hypothetical protein
VITRLLRIERREHLFPYIDVMYFREKPGASLPEIAPGGLPVPAGLEAYPSGFTLATIDSASMDWTDEDHRAFDAYIASERVNEHFAALLGEVRRTCRLIAAQGPFETRFQALMWETDCHPVRVGDTDDPMFDLLEDPYDPNAAG